MKYHHFGLPWFLQLLARIPEQLVIGSRLHRKIYGKEFVREAERIKREKGVGVLFVLNHTSRFDPIIFLPGISPVSNLAPMFYITRNGKSYKELASMTFVRLLYGGFFFYAWGSIAIPRGLKDYSQTLKKPLEALKAGKSVCIFPEGTVQRGDVLGPAHGGVTYLVEESGALIVPVHIGGLHNLVEKEFWAKERHATITFGKPFFVVDVPEYLKDDPERFRRAAESLMGRVYALKPVQSYL